MALNPDLLDVAKHAAKEGGAILRKYFSQSLSYEQKEDKTFVSVADRQSEKVVREILLKNFPDHAIVGEEEGKSGKSQYIWHVDPLDGTSNFKNNIPCCAVSIGLEFENNFILGVIYNPFADQLFYAAEGTGAFLNNRRIKVNDQPISEGIVVLDAHFAGKNSDIKLAIQKQLSSITSRFRMTGSNAMQLAELARGVYTSSLSDSVKSYDFAAGVIIVKEAGGIVTDQHGKSPNAESQIIIASNNKENHDKFLSIAEKLYGGVKSL